MSHEVLRWSAEEIGNIRMYASQSDNYKLLREETGDDLLCSTVSCLKGTGKSRLWSTAYSRPSAYVGWGEVGRQDELLGSDVVEDATKTRGRYRLRYPI